MLGVPNVSFTWTSKAFERRGKFYIFPLNKSLLYFYIYFYISIFSLYIEYIILAEHQLHQFYVTLVSEPFQEYLYFLFVITLIFLSCCLKLELINHIFKHQNLLLVWSNLLMRLFNEHFLKCRTLNLHFFQNLCLLNFLQISRFSFLIYIVVFVFS